MPTGWLGALVTVACLMGLTACAHYCPELLRGPDAPELDPPRPCGAIEACVFPFWLAVDGTAQAASPATPLGDAPSRHTNWAPGELQRWFALAQAARMLMMEDPGFVRQLAEAESLVRQRFDAEAGRLRRRCSEPPGERELERLGQRITERIYERAGIYRRLRDNLRVATSPPSQP